MSTSGPTRMRRMAVGIRTNRERKRTPTYDYRPRAVRSIGAGCALNAHKNRIHQPAAENCHADSPRPVVIRCSCHCLQIVPPSSRTEWKREQKCQYSVDHGRIRDTLFTRLRGHRNATRLTGYAYVGEFTARFTQFAIAKYSLWLSVDVAYSHLFPAFWPVTNTLRILKLDITSSR